MFENPRRGRQATNFTTNVPKILDLKSSSENIFSENRRWVPLTITIMWSSQCEAGWQSGQHIKTPFSFAIWTLTWTLTWTLIMLVSQPWHSFYIKKFLGPHVNDLHVQLYMYLGWDVGLSLIQCVKKFQISNLVEIRPIN